MMLFRILFLFVVAAIVINIPQKSSNRTSPNYYIMNDVMVNAEQDCREQLHSENPNTPWQLISNAPGFGVYSLRGQTAEVWVSYDRHASNTKQNPYLNNPYKIYKNITFICDVQVPKGIVLLDNKVLVKKD